jgi:hypothetical protein
MQYVGEEIVPRKNHVTLDTIEPGILESEDHETCKPRVLPELQTLPLYPDCQLSKRLLNRIFSAPLAPHQILTFVLMEVLGWRPRELLKLRYEPLGILLREAEAELSGLFGEQIAFPALKPLWAIMRSRKKLAEVSLPPATRNCLRPLLDAVICDTSLNDYFVARGSGPAKSPGQQCSNWVVTVRKHLKAELADDEDLAACA